MHPDWTLRVPILRPHLAAWLDSVVMATALAAALFALSSPALSSPAWRSPAVLSLAVLAACGAAVAGVLAARRSRPAVSAIRMDRDGAFHLRMRNGWTPAEWVAAWRGPRWLTLRARLPGQVCNTTNAADGYVTFTVWQDGLPAPAWRRTCVLANRRLCRTPARRAVGTP